MVGIYNKQLVLKAALDSGRPLDGCKRDLLLKGWSLGLTDWILKFSKVFGNFAICVNTRKPEHYRPLLV